MREDYPLPEQAMDDYPLPKQATDEHPSPQQAMDEQLLRGRDWKLIPNLLTLFRLIIVIPFICALWVHEYYLAIFLLWIAAPTDMLDGIIARRLNQCSSLGQVLDLFVDRILTLPAVFIIWYQGYFTGQPLYPWLAIFWAVVLIATDATIMVGVLRFIPRKLADQKLEFPEPSTFVKLTYPVQIIALSFVIGVPTWEFKIFSTVVFSGYLILASIMTIMAGILYMRVAGWLFKSGGTPLKPEEKPPE